MSLNRLDDLRSGAANWTAISTSRVAAKVGKCSPAVQNWEGRHHGPKPVEQA
jgi:hypothetical protein